MMLIAGAGGHAKEILGILHEGHFEEEIIFFDDSGRNQDLLFLGRYPIIHSLEEAKELFQKNNRFVLGVGKPLLRRELSEKLISVGGDLCSVISPFAQIGSVAVNIGVGANIMTNAVITQNLTIGTGVLIHVHCSVHHDTVIGDFSELSPGCRILGAASIGAFVSIGAGAIVLPGIKIEDHVLVGAGAVVTKDVRMGNTVVGIPARSV